MLVFKYALLKTKKQKNTLKTYSNLTVLGRKVGDDTRIDYIVHIQGNLGDTSDVADAPPLRCLERHIAST